MQATSQRGPFFERAELATGGEPNAQLLAQNCPPALGTNLTIQRLN